MPRILVAEDNPLNFELVRAILEAGGHEVTWARDGQQALDLIELTGGFRLILVDLHMPNVDGLTVIRAVRQRSSPEAPRIMVLTADLLPTVQEEVMAAGADAYMVKPLDVERLRTEVDRLLAS